MVINVNNHSKPPIFARGVMVLLLIAPVLQCYGWGKYDFSFIIFSLLSVYHVLKKGIHGTKTPRLLLCYWGWWYITHIITSSSIGDILHLGIIKIVITYIMYIDIFDVNYFMPKYKKIANIFIAYFFIQEFCRLALGYNLLNVVTFLPLAVIEDAQFYYESNLEAIRSCSFFKEPAVFAQYLLPLLCYELFGVSKTNYRYIVFLSVTLLWSRTGNAIIGLLAIAVCYIFYLLKKTKGMQRIKYLVFSFFMAVCVLTVFFKTNDGQEIIERTASVNASSTLEKGYAGSTFMRLYQGYFIFKEFSSLYKLVGNDHGDYILTQAFQSPVVSSLYQNKEFVTYFNAIYSVFIYTGIIGFILMFIFIRSIWRNNTFCGRSMLFVLIAICMVSSNFFTTTMALYLVPAITMNKRNSS